MNEFANLAFASLHGYTPMELKEIMSDALVAEIDRAEWRQSMQNALSTGTGFSLEIGRVRKDGTTFPSVVKVTPDPPGAGGQYLLEVHDREEQTTITKALNDDRRLLLASFQQLPIPLLVLSPDLSHVLSQSDAFCNMFPNPKKLTNSELVKAHRAVIRHIQNAGKELGARELAISAKDTGMTADIVLQTKQVIDFAGAVLAITVVITHV
jgi:PAS domain S-box-containing protein